MYLELFSIINLDLPHSLFAGPEYIDSMSSLGHIAPHRQGARCAQINKLAFVTHLIGYSSTHGLLGKTLEDKRNRSKLGSIHLSNFKVMQELLGNQINFNL